ncbi:MAG: plasmid mobilization protein [Anaerorhabdus sp.]
MSKKVYDRKNRWRSKSVGFNMSPGEVEHLDKLVAISGLSKQDYIISRLLCRDIIVQGNPRVYKALRNQLNDVLVELKRIDGLIEGVDDELLELIKMITITLDGLKEENKKSPYPAR